MFTPLEFKELVSGRSRGWSAAVWRGLLRVAQQPYSMAVRWRNARYDSGRARVERMSVPVISVGNITTGGTGKTPMVEWLARWFLQRQIRVALVSRGYGARAGVPNDEALELSAKLPDVPHVQNPDRVAAAQEAIDEHHASLILLDDAFQHRRIYRDLDLVLIDALEPFGFGHLLPRGLLREPLHGLARADVIVLTRADLVDDSERDAIRRECQRHAPATIWIEAAQQPCHLLSATGERLACEQLVGKRVAAFCGIGNPAGFRRTLEQIGCAPIGWREFPDHHPYSPADLIELKDWVTKLPEIWAVVCTQKDLVKINTDRWGQIPLWALGVETRIVSGEDSLAAKLQELIP